MFGAKFPNIVYLLIELYPIAERITGTSFVHLLPLEFWYGSCLILCYVALALAEIHNWIILGRGSHSHSTCSVHKCCTRWDQMDFCWLVTVQSWSGLYGVCESVDDWCVKMWDVLSFERKSWPTVTLHLTTHIESLKDWRHTETSNLKIFERNELPAKLLYNLLGVCWVSVSVCWQTPGLSVRCLLGFCYILLGIAFEIILDLPFGFPINNIISLSSLLCVC